jgi:hypothetical protein
MGFHGIDGKMADFRGYFGETTGDVRGLFECLMVVDKSVTNESRLL